MIKARRETPIANARANALDARTKRDSFRMTRSFRCVLSSVCNGYFALQDLSEIFSFRPLNGNAMLLDEMDSSFAPQSGTSAVRITTIRARNRFLHRI